MELPRAAREGSANADVGHLVQLRLEVWAPGHLLAPPAALERLHGQVVVLHVTGHGKVRHVDALLEEVPRPLGHDHDVEVLQPRGVCLAGPHDEAARAGGVGEGGLLEEARGLQVAEAGGAEEGHDLHLTVPDPKGMLRVNLEGGAAGASHDRVIHSLPGPRSGLCPIERGDGHEFRGHGPCRGGDDCQRGQAHHGCCRTRLGLGGGAHLS
mmetsp:Transcript_33050/g.74966  ORF Transcript_33050/g.74966 Transcript_33050/m.74966 type:complete len:211 (+) Transcript_33050:469-1101(+)